MSPYIECPASAKYQVSIPEAPVTEKYKAHVPPEGSLLENSGIVRATYAPTSEAPNGTEKDDWAEKHQHQTVSSLVVGANIPAADQCVTTGP